RTRSGWAAAALLFIPGLFLLVYSTRPRPDGALVKLPLGVAGAGFTLSPDGRSVAYLSAGIWVRTLDSLDARRIAGGETATAVFWSPDSRHLGFFADGKLRRVALGGGESQILCDAPGAASATWSPRGGIVFDGLRRVPATGGETHRLVDGRAPRFLPDAQRFLYTAGGAIHLGRLGSPDSVRLAEGREAMYAPGRAGRAPQLVWLRGSTLVACRFDARGERLAGDPVAIAEDARAFSLAAGGTLLYESAVHGPVVVLNWMRALPR
ncbi:MAG: TolB family protein, partial [Bryobacteraceae bacterium]